MKPRSDVKIDRVAFEKMKRVLPAFLAAQRGTSPENHAEDHSVRDLPDEMAFKLTNRCNLRCKHCYQWNEEGHHRDLAKAEQNRDLDFAVIEKAFAATRERKSNVYLWGGEPLIYRDWERLADLLERDPRWTSMCTNGIGIENRLDSILRISEKFEILFAVEGFREEHDAIRGKSTWDRTMRGIDLLLEEKRRGRYRGEIAINCVITDAILPRLHELLESFEAQGIDTVYLSLLWYLSDETSAKMDRYVARHFNWMCTDGEPARASWHAYKYRLDPAAGGRLMDALRRVDARSWKMKLRYNPALDLDEIPEFILGSDRPAQGKTRCLAIKTRMDVMPNGDVVSCKFFPEFAAGNLGREEVREVWHGSRFNILRDTIDQGLMPVCSKCNLLYSRGI
ncbi:MAG TPA: radical SAM protein [Thermoanaerobaculia bacterium]|jgi:radical SAM protein with 4Fe4S-binding SPASM domain